MKFTVDVFYIDDNKISFVYSDCYRFNFGNVANPSASSASVGI